MLIYNVNHCKRFHNHKQYFIIAKKDLKKTFSQVINIFRVVYEIEEKTCQYWRDQWFFILKRVSFMSWWKLISPIFYECLIVKRNEKRETRNSGKKQELWTILYIQNRWITDTIFMQGTFIFPNRESIRIPISRALIHPLKSMPFPTQRTKTLPNTILKFSELMHRGCSTCISFKRIIPPFFNSLVPKELSLELPYQVSLLGFSKRFQQKRVLGVKSFAGKHTGLI